jgi:hypothetical protein
MAGLARDFQLKHHGLEGVSTKAPALAYEVCPVWLSNANLEMARCAEGEIALVRVRKKRRERSVAR